MSHCINAFVVNRDIAKRITFRFTSARALMLTDDLSIIPLTDELFDQICKEQPSPNIEPFWKLNEILLKAILDTASEAIIGYFETDLLEELAPKLPLFGIIESQLPNQNSAQIYSLS